MRFCSSGGQNIGQYIRHITAGCSYQHTSFPTVLRVHIVQHSKEYFEKWIKYLKLKKNKMADIVQDYTKKLCAPHVFGCPLYIHNTKKACFVRLMGCPYAPYIWMPHMFGCPLYVWMAPICLDAPYTSLYVWVPLCLDAPVCLDTPICLDAPVLT